MKNKIKCLSAWLLILITINFTCIHQELPGLPKEIPEEVILPHVVIGSVSITQNKTLKVRFGSGTVIAHKNKRTYILTALHVTILDAPKEGRYTKLVVWPKNNERGIYARFEKTAKYGVDAAIISTYIFNRKVARISNKDPQLGEPVFVLGSPSGSYRTIYRRRIQILTGNFSCGLQNCWRRFELDGSILRGFSGGGVYNSENELLGISYARHGNGDYEGIGIPITTLNELIKPYIEDDE